MEATNKMTNIEMFHKVSQKNTNIVTTDYIKEILKNHPNFDWEEFNKSSAEVDFQKCARSVDMTQITAIWTQNTESQHKFPQQYQMRKGHLLSIGSSVNKSNNILIIKNVKPKWCYHNFKFGEDNQKKLLNTIINDIDMQTLSTTDLRWLSTIKINVPLYTDPETKQLQSQATLEQFQSQATLEQFKYVQLIEQLIGIQIASLKASEFDSKFYSKHKDTDSDFNFQHCRQYCALNLKSGKFMCAGFIQQKYIHSKGLDQQQFQGEMQLIGFQGKTPTQLINIMDPDKPFNKELGIHPDLFDIGQFTIAQLTKVINDNYIDIGIQIDTTSVIHPYTTIKPRINIVFMYIRGGRVNGNYEDLYTRNTRTTSKYMNTKYVQNSLMVYIRDEQIRICRICLDYLQQPKILNPCGHVFCLVCIQRANQSRNKCPLCSQEYIDPVFQN